MNGTELLHFSWSLCIGAEVAVQTAAGAGPATRVVHRAAVFPSQAEKMITYGGNNEADSSSAPENRHLRRKGKP
ncbi:hypothetical protein ACH5RR_018395 [Cinchona calisaya]|uniref:Uncharacterized protein n=1 Tax=Cinchona calisaya TaxID=153742 RepID=A0ABD2ZLF9_9GENT